MSAARQPFYDRVPCERCRQSQVGLFAKEIRKAMIQAHMGDPGHICCTCLDKDRGD